MTSALPFRMGIDIGSTTIKIVVLNQENKIIFNFNNEENGQLISSHQLIEKTKQLEKAGLMNLSYTFNHFLTEEKTLNELKPYISTNRDVTRN